ncbi:glycosyltransferase [Aliivibrio fischeri]|uniref:glycosyltransferase family 4 protein n=1 Tax=Aliivibrio fischeri TaxID=668 RepID=UPI0012D90E47|nr:glycosyltransferase family 4 protein [Aliivibrio fischeri]MUH96827.1 glycosyltransferase [Aliivibrio fischeri]MUI63806.1 glycosyltransferase [Aliivibrio fischeri]
MNIVHICNNYVGTKVHLNQVEALSKINNNIIQTVVIPITNKKHLKINNTEVRNVKLKYFVFNNIFLKYFPFMKMLYLSFLILKDYHSEIKKADVVYCHTLWTNGFIGLVCYVIYRKKYIVTVRSTDYHTFLKKMPHYRFIMRFIIKYSSKVIFLSPSYRDKTIKKYPFIFSGAKLKIIPNGIDEEWREKYVSSEKNNVLLISRFVKNKNISSVIQAVNLSRENTKNNIQLTIVGGDKAELKNLLSLKTIPNWITIRGKINNKSELAKIYAEHKVFSLVSYQETFGLVYLEALSQGCSVICSKNEAIDGFFEGFNSVISVEPLNISEISKAIELQLSTSFDFNNDILKNDFYWDSIASKILGVIRDIKND